MKISQLMTDNGPAYRSKRFRRTLRELGIGHIFTRPYTPRTNGKVERFIRTSTEEWAYGRSYRHSRVRAQALRVWLDYYNLVRRHTAIGRRTPLPHLVELMVTNVLETHTGSMIWTLSPAELVWTIRTAPPSDSSPASAGPLRGPLRYRRNSFSPIRNVPVRHAAHGYPRF